MGILLLSEKVKSIGKLYTGNLIGLFCLPPIFAKANTAIHSSATFKSNFNCELVRFVFLQIDIKQACPWIYFFHFHFHIIVELDYSWFCKDLKANTESDLFLLSNTYISYLIQPARRACALRALGLLLADGVPTVGRGKTF